ncbi:MAG: CsbD family protein [Xanthobacteraceae bacterium]
MDKDRIAGAAKDVAGKAEGAFGKVTGDAETEISGRAREAAGTAQNAFGQAKDAVRDLGEAASNYAQDALDAGGDYYRDGSRAVTAKIREQPMTALLAAGAIGFTLGVLLTRQPRQRNWRDYYR